ncbi:MULTISPECIES: hypothetical protein [unclassified Arcicella]|uniref:hypothetical protein n=1 Tax=unclassified Arcicella TaxID=2644986 RepID=UPI002861154A|nr:MULTISPECIES: hypothetical protein [unclassified Arcicella]MDR6563738.1 hypothetical protein [Arcicella sp. BE51]MDR6813578.1 hypothetical protein [Arcicella sp. BE140]MDR6824890.1 hypothetical protein [Arcicella sp. BE139]|eukprot:GDKK01041787.1.p1 GENE.GDKK01041787.1~~GDKK01041787.1.p1  ORF type:complete len:136 (+),score=4.46 GDKK01041787.1:66-473(+)
MKKITMLFALVLISSLSIFAQKENHKHSSPHGGIVKSAGDYHLEIKTSSGMLMVYLLDGNEKSLAIGNATANATLQTEDGQVVTLALPSNKKDGFMAMIDKNKKFHKAIITVSFNGKTANATFDLVEDGHSEHKH